MQLFGAGANRGATDLVWRQAFRNEVACADNQHALSVLIDLAKCYEHVRHILLAKEAREMDFPMVLLRITIRAYAWARKLTLDKRVCEDVMPSRGIIAGCASATSELKAVMYRSCTAVVKRNPSVNLYIDDLTLDGQGSRGGVTEDVMEAAHDLIDMCQDVLKMPIAKNKLAVVASDNGLANKAARRLGSSEYAKTQTRNLGIGYRAGKAKHKGRCATRKRWEIAVAKAKRARMVSKVSSKGATKLFVTGVVPAIAYGGEVHGIKPQQVKKARQLAKQLASGACKNASLEGVLLLDPARDPARRLVEMPILRYATELWHASERSQVRPKNIKLAVLVTGTRKVMDRIKHEPKGANGAKGP